MLEPTERRHLLESLRPPEGYSLTHALGTTYSMDLLSLLTVPLAFSLFDWEAQDGTPTKDPLALLEALRRHAEHMLIFCQAGAIYVPENPPLLLASLEPSVIEVRPARETGIFHPKTWLLRFASTDGPVLYRFLCASRNLTFDRSWDTILVLEGVLEERKKGFGVNRPLADFIGALPALASHGVPPSRMELVQTMLREVRKVRFAPPEGFEEIAFLPIGIDGYRRWPFPEGMKQLLVVSPFLTPALLQRLSDSAQEAVLVSRLETLQELSRKQLRGFSRVFTLAAEADPEMESEGTTDPLLETAAYGLHAKLYVGDTGWDSKVWTGSANATNAAFWSNVEFLVELTGKRSFCGVDSVLRSTQGRMEFADLLQAFTPQTEAVASDAAQHALEEGIEEARRLVVGAKIQARVEEAGEPDSYTVTLRAGPKAGEIAPGPDRLVELWCWPITLPEEQAVALKGLTGDVARFERLSFPGLTAFFAFRVDVAHAGKRQSSRFVLNLPLEGSPEDRRERLLRYLLQDRNQVLRLLLLILADVEGDAFSEAAVRRLFVEDAANGGFLYSAALLEPLLRALASNPDRLDEVARLIADLDTTPEGQALLPEGLHRVWDPIWSAREARRE